MDDSSLMNILTTQGELVPDHLYMVAIHKEGGILTGQNRLTEANLDYLRALTLTLRLL